jgi:exportin-2 (importin alpha re-exporter)
VSHKNKWVVIRILIDFILDQIKNVIVTLMITVPTALQLQLSEAVTLIADNDFPDQWASLIQVSY